MEPYPRYVKKRRRWKKPLIILIVVVLIVGIIWLVVKSLNKPAEGSISQTPPTKQEVTDPYSEPGKYDSKYVSFTYPAHYKVSNGQLSGNYVEVVELNSTHPDGRHITVGVLKQDLNIYTGFVYRTQHPELYKKNPTTKYGQSFTALNTSQGSEITAFTRHNGLLGTVSVTSSGVQDLTSDMTTVLDSLAWK